MLGLGAPQIIYLILLFLGVGAEAVKHGQPKKGNHNFWVALTGAGLVMALHYWGGFYG